MDKNIRTKITVHGINLIHMWKIRSTIKLMDTNNNKRNTIILFEIYKKGLIYLINDKMDLNSTKSKQFFFTNIKWLYAGVQ